MAHLTPKERFDAQYITSYEIAKRLGVNRSTVYTAWRKGKLPQPFIIGDHIHAWERSSIEPLLPAWIKRLEELKSR